MADKDEARRRLERLKRGYRRLRDERTRLEERVRELENLAFHDPDTGLPIRRRFLRDLEEALSSVDPSNGNRRLAVALVRMDRAYQRIRHTRDRSKVFLFRTASIMTKIAGPVLYQSDRTDEFAMILRNMPGLHTIEVIIERILEEVSKPQAAPAEDIAFSCHFGVALFPDHGDASEELLSAARIAADRAERDGSPFVFYDDGIGLVVREAEIIESELSRLSQVGFDSFRMLYQPFVGARDFRIVGAEALIRWTSATLGPVSPASFIPIAEETGEIRHIGHWTLYQACRTLRRFLDSGCPDLHMSVNLSPAQFKQHDLLERIDSLMRAAGIEGRFLKLELTEGSTMEDPELAKRIMHELRDRGIRLSIDDFGTGYSSLSYLASLPLDTLKIDRSFVQGIDDGDGPSETGRQVVRAVISLARNIGLETLAEGVETEEQLAFLVDEGCDYIQGYYFSEAVDPDRFLGYLGGGCTLGPAAKRS